MTTQHERDQETGLDYRGARYYDSDVVRFLSLDPKAANYASWSPALPRVPNNTACKRSPFWRVLGQLGRPARLTSR